MAMHCWFRSTGEISKRSGFREWEGLYKYPGSSTIESELGELENHHMRNDEFLQLTWGILL